MHGKAQKQNMKLAYIAYYTLWIKLESYCEIQIWL
jgi:hypothetical protein